MMIAGRLPACCRELAGFGRKSPTLPEEIPDGRGSPWTLNYDMSHSVKASTGDFATIIEPFRVVGHDRDYMPLPGSYRVNPDDHAWATLAFTSGAMASTADDLATWIDALMHGAVLPDFDLDAATNVRDARNPAIPELAGYGLGLERLRIYGEDWFGHLGGFVGFGGAVLYAPRTDRTIAVLGNMSTFHGVGAVRAIARVLAYQDNQPRSAQLSVDVSSLV